MSQTLRVIGNTKPKAAQLKKDGFRWQPERQCWWQSISDVHAEQLTNEATRDATLEAFRMRYQGCRVLVGQTVVFTSKRYVEPAQYRETAAERASERVWNTDAHGNAVRGVQIRGSSPDDLV